MGRTIQETSLAYICKGLPQHKSMYPQESMDSCSIAGGKVSKREMEEAVPRLHLSCSSIQSAAPEEQSIVHRQWSRLSSMLLLGCCRSMLPWDTRQHAMAVMLNLLVLWAGYVAQDQFMGHILGVGFVTGLDPAWSCSIGSVCRCKPDCKPGLAPHAGSSQSDRSHWPNPTYKIWPQRDPCSGNNLEMGGGQW